MVQCIIYFHIKKKYSFKFPLSDQGFHQIDSAEDLRQKLNAEKEKTTDIASYLIQRRCNQETKELNSIYCHCQVCKIIIHYKLNTLTRKLELVRFENQHTHIARARKTAHQMVCQLLKTVPENTPLKELYQMARERYHIGLAAFYYVMRKIKGVDKPPPPLKVITPVNEIDYGYYWSYPPQIKQEQMPDVALFYFSFVKYCSNDVYLFLKEFHLKLFHVVIFCGFNLNGQLIPHGFVFIKKMSVHTLSSVLQYYRKFSEKQYLNIVVPYDINVTNALQQLNSTEEGPIYYYIYDKELFLDCMSVNDNPPEILTTLTNLHFQQDADYILNNLNKEQCTQNTVMGQILQNPHKYLISKFISRERSSIGFIYNLDAYTEIKGFLNRRLRKFSRLHKDKFNDQVSCLIESMKQLIDEVRKNELSIIKISFNKSQLHFEEEQLNQIRHLVSKKVFNIFLKHYAVSFKIQMVRTEEFQCEEDLMGRKYVLNLINNQWECQCGFYFRFSLPCSHIIKIIRETGKKNIQQYIPEEWFIDEEVIKKEKSKIRLKPGRPKGSRRNMCK